MVKANVGDFVYILELNSISKGRVIRRTENEGEATKYMIECLDDLYFDVSENCIYKKFESFSDAIAKYLG